jgi:catechol 2,3-dioxygenase-like lactoylglutathione lyase family enzyme
MPAFVKLLVVDADRSRSFYEALGFTTVHRDPVFTHLRWTSDAELYLVRIPTGRTFEGRRGLGVLVCFRADHVGVHEVAQRATAAGATVEGPTDQPWHTREVLVTDPDGYRLNFLQSSWPLEGAADA